MRLSAEEKQEIILLVDRSELGVNRTLKELGIHKSTFYKWYKVYPDKGLIGLIPRKEPGSSGTRFPKSKNSLSWKWPWITQSFLQESFR